MAKLRDIIIGKGLTLIPQLHLQQVDLFLWRKGIELYPEQDENNVRADLLRSLYTLNRTSLYLTDIWNKGAKGGSILLYVRPNGKNYRLNYYTASEFQPAYNADGDLDSVTIETTYSSPQDRYIKIILTSERISKWDSDRPISDLSAPDTITPNPYGFIPAVIIDNKPCGVGKRGLDEFSALAGQIEAHDWLLDQVQGNIEFFGGPIFFSSRSRAEMTEAGMIEDRHSVAAAGGYGERRSQARIKARRIFDNLEPGEQIGFASPEPIDGKSYEYIQQFARSIRAALGSVDETEAASTSQGSTYELKTILGRVIQTAARRAESYLTFGIAQAYSLMLQMAEYDGVIPTIGHNHTVKWRYLGDVFQESPQDQLTKSIVCRNLLRLGVNVKECLRFLFPDKRDSELDDLLSEGFAYEFLNGIANVASTLTNAKDPVTGEYAIAIDEFIQEVIRGRPAAESDRQSTTDPNRSTAKSFVVSEPDRETTQSERRNPSTSSQGRQTR